MTTRTATGVHSFRQNLATAWAGIRDRLRRNGVRLKRERRARRAIEELAALDDRMLADIGMHRGSIGFAARHGYVPREPAPVGLRSLIARESPPRRQRRARYG